VQRDGRRLIGTHQEQWKKRFERDRRLRSALEDLLIPRDAVQVIAYGAGGSAVIGTSAGALVYKRGIKAGVPFGYRLKPFEYESVVAINVREVADGVVLAVHAPLKVGSCTVYWLDERDDAWKARNAVMADSRGRAELFESVAVELRTLMAAHHARHGRATPAPQPFITPVPRARHESCSGCGAQIEAEWRYCPDCGISFGSPAERWSWPRATHGATR
jgi:hypothetical protein